MGVGLQYPGFDITLYDGLENSLRHPVPNRLVIALWRKMRGVTLFWIPAFSRFTITSLFFAVDRADEDDPHHSLPSFQSLLPGPAPRTMLRMLVAID